MDHPQRDYRKLAAALAPDIPAAELDRVVQPLESLEAAFRPLTAALADETEPAFTVRLSTEWPA
ncbi:MAG TPA: hypothetical protein VFB63_05535 [Bryobacteraceae bacterium]|jgi:hypothetical protein|nr:hypothetical protein [Bryobacteraceae bacterium]